MTSHFGHIHKFSEKQNEKSFSSPKKEEHIRNDLFELSVKFMRDNDLLRRTYISIYLSKACGLWISNDKYRRHRLLCYLLFIYEYYDSM